MNAKKLQRKERKKVKVILHLPVHDSSHNQLLQLYTQKMCHNFP